MHSKLIVRRPISVLLKPPFELVSKLAEPTLHTAVQQQPSILLQDATRDQSPPRHQSGLPPYRTGVRRSADTTHERRSKAVLSNQDG